MKPTYESYPPKNPTAYYDVMEEKPIEYPNTYLRRHCMKPVADYWQWCVANNLTPYTVEAMRVWVTVHFSLLQLQSHRDVEVVRKDVSEFLQ